VGAVPATRQAGRRRLTPDEEERIIEAYLRGDPVAEIAARHGVSVSTIYDVLYRRGIMPSMRRRRRVTPDEEAEILRLRMEGLGVTEIARRLGRSPSTIHAVLKRRGLA